MVRVTVRRIARAMGSGAFGFGDKPAPPLWEPATVAAGSFLPLRVANIGYQLTDTGSRIPAIMSTALGAVRPYSRKPTSQEATQ